MKYRSLGESHLEASVVTLGAWAIGGWMWGGQEEAEAIATIQTAIDHGINCIDTAPMYGMGQSEKLVGKAIAGRRDEVIIATKCGMRWDTDQGTLFFKTDDDAINEAGDKAVHIYNGPDGIVYEVEQSLQRLNIDCIDLYQTHWQDLTTPLQETVGALQRLVEQGKIKAFGPCNANMEQLQVYAKGGASTDQEKYSMLDRDLESTNLDFCLQQGLSTLAYSPMANGLLTGRIGPDRVFPSNDLRSSRPRFSIENRKRVAVFLERLQPIAEGYQLTLAQLVICWTLQQPGITHTLVGARTPQQAIENAQAGSIELTASELALVDQALAELGEVDAAIPPSASIDE